ncbi:MAG: YraN family protein [Pseudomonadota bacterium]
MSGRRFHAGLSAEEQVARHYEAQGARTLERRLRTPEGEIDLVVELPGILVFVEVKARKHHGPESPISEKQWQRLGLAAEFYMMHRISVTGATPVCRFDAALIGPDGRLEVIENARMT